MRGCKFPLKHKWACKGTQYIEEDYCAVSTLYAMVWVAMLMSWKFCVGVVFPLSLCLAMHVQMCSSCTATPCTAVLPTSRTTHAGHTLLRTMRHATIRCGSTTMPATLPWRKWLAIPFWLGKRMPLATPMLRILSSDKKMAETVLPMTEDTTAVDYLLLLDGKETDLKTINCSEFTCRIVWLGRKDMMFACCEWLIRKRSSFVLLGG